MRGSLGGEKSVVTGPSSQPALEVQKSTSTIMYYLLLDIGVQGGTVELRGTLTERDRPHRAV